MYVKLVGCMCFCFSAYKNWNAAAIIPAAGVSSWSYIPFFAFPLIKIAIQK